jgi:IPT/TIG domain
VGDHTTRWEPVRVEKDIMGNLLPQIQKAVCSHYSSYAIDVFGNLYSWGKGYLGHKNLTLEDLPRKIELNTENRYFTDVFTNKEMVGFYAPIRIFSISPRCGPAYGGTLLSIIGTGFVYSDKLRVRFSYGNLNQEVSCTYEPKTKTLYCKTPKFQEFEGQTQTTLKFP